MTDQPTQTACTPLPITLSDDDRETLRRITMWLEDEELWARQQEDSRFNACIVTPAEYARRIQLLRRLLGE